jgi:hypothetical protein
MYSIKEQWQEKPTGWFPRGAMEWHPVNYNINCSIRPEPGNPD